MAGGTHREEIDFGAWRTPASPYAVEYSLHVLEELRAYAEEGYKKIPHGGIEVGALLLGSAEGATVRIFEWRPLECEHARGPGFVLSERDLKGLDELLATVASDPVLQGLVPVGWMHTHTRSTLHLSEEDIAIHDRFFPGESQTAMVLTMGKDQPARSGFFFRGAAGRMDGSASPLVMDIFPNPVMRARPPRKTAAPPRPAPEAPKPAAAAPPRRTGPSRARPLGYTPDHAASYAPPVPRPEPPSYVPVPSPVPEQAPQPVALRWRLLAIAAVVGAIAATAVLTRPLWMPSIADSVSLRVQEQYDQIVIRWDHAAPSVLRAQSAALEIHDGAIRKRIELNQEEARRGSVTYARSGEDVEVRLILFEGGQPVKQESARFLGPPLTAAQAAAPSPDTAGLTEERTRLREELRAEQQRSEKLRESLRQLEARLKQQ